MKEWWRIELAQHIKDGIVVGEEGGDLRDLGEGLRQGGRINDAKMEEAVIMIWLMFSLPLLTSRAYFHHGFSVFRKTATFPTAQLHA